MNTSAHNSVILGGGLTGLAAGRVLADAGCAVTICEREAVVGGLSRTIEKNGYRFDLGGHRFHTTDAAVDRFVRQLMGEELVTVPRSSKICLRGKYFDYPLRPLNAMFGLGMPVTVRIIADYAWERFRRTGRKPEARTLEEWVVENFGRTMFDVYFKEYSEKVWGIGCDRISASWVAQRIKGLSLAKAIKNALFRFSGKEIATLADRFLYPSRGIGRLAERMREEIERTGTVLTGAEISQITHDGKRIVDLRVRRQGEILTVSGDSYISSIPLTRLAGMLRPAPPSSVQKAAANLRFRDLVIVAVMVNREQITDQTWIYVPERRIPFGRIHEPTNWSREMAPAGHSLLVVEYFSFRGDAIWSLDDHALADLTIGHLATLGFLPRNEVADSMVVRVPNAYPLFELGYQEHVGVLRDFFDGFENLAVAGRSGMFSYYNMDVALRSGMDTAERIISSTRRSDSAGTIEPMLAGLCS